jgi:hypothetical protein
MRNPRFSKYWLLICCLILFHLVSNCFWIRRDAGSLGSDVSSHTDIAVSIHQDLRSTLGSGLPFFSKIKSTFNLINNSGPYPFWPRLVHFIAAFTALIPGDPLFSIRFSNMIYLAILLVCIYLLGKKIESPQAGLISACVVSFYPAVFGISRKFSLDFPLMAAVSLIMYCLVNCDYFRDRRYSIFFGLSLGAGMLIKSQCFLFVILPFVYAVVAGFRRGSWEKPRFLNIFIAMFFAFSISLIWWYKLFTDSTSAYFIHENFLSRSPNSEFKGGSLMGEMTYYIKAAGLNISLLFSFMFLAGTPFFLKNLRRKYYGIILAWLVSPYLFFSLIPTKLDRYIFPSFGAVALVSVFGWLRAPLRKSIKIVILAVFLGLGFCQFLNFSWKDKDSLNWSHAPTANNHRLISENISKAIRRYGNGNSKVAIIEEKYFHGDRCIRLSYFLKLSGGIGMIYLSGRGGAEYFGEPEWLLGHGEHDFLIMFSRDGYQLGMEFPGDFLNKLEGENFNPKDYIVIEEQILFPEKLNIFLLMNRNLMVKKEFFREDSSKYLSTGAGYGG